MNFCTESSYLTVAQEFNDLIDSLADMMNKKCSIEEVEKVYSKMNDMRKLVIKIGNSYYDKERKENKVGTIMCDGCIECKIESSLCYKELLNKEETIANRYFANYKHQKPNH